MAGKLAAEPTADLPEGALPLCGSARPEPGRHPEPLAGPETPRRDVAAATSTAALSG